MKKILISLLAIGSISTYAIPLQRDMLFNFDASQIFDTNECSNINICKPFKLQDENAKFSETIYRKIYRCFGSGEEVHIASLADRTKIYTSKNECLNSN